ncbi:hypothetical protein [Alteromonas antoniana]|uniref:hypothetical protein n=1 Tax=Alteromonas antoniana TaxID=2803813 RepID=UPI001C4420FD|nr:hypothetical protein [Alteromonas antoniana]
MPATLLTSKEIKNILKVSDCELMHRRTNGELSFIKQGNAFLYELPCELSLLQHPLGEQLLGWHRSKHDSDIENLPQQESTKRALELFVEKILLPIERAFSTPLITYGFTSHKLKMFVSKHASKGIAPNIDQHSGFERNSRGVMICERGGAACDFQVNEFSSADITRFIVANLEFDRLYYYGNDRPIHVSIHPENPAKHLQIMGVSSKGRRYPGQKAFGDDAIELAENLI